MKQTGLASGFLSFLRFLRKYRAGRQAGVHRSRECLLPFPPSKSFRVPMRQQDNRILQYLSLSLSLSDGGGAEAASLLKEDEKQNGKGILLVYGADLRMWRLGLVKSCALPSYSGQAVVAICTLILAT